MPAGTAPGSGGPPGAGAIRDGAGRGDGIIPAGDLHGAGAIPDGTGDGRLNMPTDGTNAIIVPAAQGLSPPVPDGRPRLVRSVTGRRAAWPTDVSRPAHTFLQLQAHAAITIISTALPAQLTAATDTAEHQRIVIKALRKQSLHSIVPVIRERRPAHTDIPAVLRLPTAIIPTAAAAQSDLRAAVLHRGAAIGLDRHQEALIARQVHPAHTVLPEAEAVVAAVTDVDPSCGVRLQ